MIIRSPCRNSAGCTNSTSRTSRRSWRDCPPATIRPARSATISSPRSAGPGSRRPAVGARPGRRRPACWGTLVAEGSLTLQKAASEKATLGGGCFWCLEPVYAELEGVVAVEPGYSGGHVENPTYEAVCTGETGHAEVVQITFDPDVISYRDILEVFFSIHDPTTLNRQGADVGTQYRSVIFYHDDEQRQVAEDVIRELEEAGVWDDPIVTQVEPAQTFYPAEDYHRR